MAGLPGRLRRRPAAGRASLAAALLLVLGSAAAPPAQAAGDAAKGRDLARRYCTRCHVVGDLNRYGGIDSTPSFQIILKQDDWRDRFSGFYALRPHPVFVRVPGVTEPRVEPSHVATFEVTQQQIDDLLAYVETLKGK